MMIIDGLLIGCVLATILGTLWALLCVFAKWAWNN